MPSATVEPTGSVPDSIPSPVLEGPEVILRRRRGASPEIAPPPLPRVLSRVHQALRETEAAILREWEALKTERQRLGDWSTQLEQRTKVVSCQFASERSELERGREDLREDLEKVIEREREAAREERRLLKKKEHLDQREVVVTEYHEKLKAYNAMLEEQRDKQTATEAALQKLQQKLGDKAGKISLAEENLRAKGVSLEERASYLIRQEKELAWREEMWERRDKLLAEHEREAEEREKKLEERVCWFQVAQAAHVAQMAQVAPVSQATETMKKTLEDLRAEQRIGVQHITAWADEASSALVPLGVSPIPVLKRPVSISDALPMLDSAADRL
jgi:DNA repair exonuclease SbcCD ATPase subunit